MKSSYRNRLDNVILNIATLGALIFLYLLYSDSWMFSKENLSDTKPIGVIQQSKVDVRRKNKHQFIWKPIQIQEIVYTGDSIFTGSNSNTTIGFNSGHILTVDEDTLLVLDQKNEYTQLDLKFGRVTSLINASESPIKFKIDSQELKFYGYDARIIFQKEPNKTLNIKVKKGKLQIKNNSSKRLVELNNETDYSLSEIAQLPSATPNPLVNDGNINSNANSLTKELSIFEQKNHYSENDHKDDLMSGQFIQLNSWTSDYIYWTTPQAKLHFKWMYEGYFDHFILSIYHNKDLKENIASVNLTSQDYNWTPPLVEENIYWKVQSVDKNGSIINESPLIKWSLKNLVAPKWNETKLEKIIELTRDENNVVKSISPIEIRWDTELPTYQFRIEIAQNENFSNPHIIETKTKYYIINELFTGKNYLRVLSEGVGRPNSTWSTVYILNAYENFQKGIKDPVRQPALSTNHLIPSVTVSVVNEKSTPSIPKLPLKLKKPNLKRPANHEAFILSQMTELQIKFQWDADVIATRHIIQFSKNNSFSIINYSAEITSAEFLLDQTLLKGKYFWRVISLNPKENLKSDWSDLHSFSVSDIAEEY